MFAVLEEIKTFVSSLTGCVTADAALADRVCISRTKVCLCARQRKKERGCLIEPSLSPLAVISCFPSQTLLDVSVPLVCYCWAEALVVDHSENCEAQGTVIP